MTDFLLFCVFVSFVFGGLGFLFGYMNAKNKFKNYDFSDGYGSGFANGMKFGRKLGYLDSKEAKKNDNRS